MSSENSSSIGSNLAFSALFTAPEVVSVVKRNGGLTKSKLAGELETFNKFVKNAKNPADVKDIFSKTIEINNNYEAYKQAAKAASIKVPLKDKLLNPLRKLFGKDLVTTQTIEAQKGNAIKSFNTLKTRLANGENVALEMAEKQAVKKASVNALSKSSETKGIKKIIETITKRGAKEKINNPTIFSEKELNIINESSVKAAKEFAKINATSLSKIGNMFKKELTSPLVILFTAFESIPDIKEKVIPAFKEKGFKEGMKQTGLVLSKTALKLVSFATGSTLGRVLGGTLGTLAATVLCPGAAFMTAIGTTVGSILGISATSAVSGKIIDKVENKIAQNEAKKQSLDTQM